MPSLSIASGFRVMPPWGSSISRAVFAIENWRIADLGIEAVAMFRLLRLNAAVGWFVSSVIAFWVRDTVARLPNIRASPPVVVPVIGICWIVIWVEWVVVGVVAWGVDGV